MAEKKISQLTAKGATVADTDLLVVSESAGGGTYVTKSVTGANVKGLVTDANLTTTDITTNDVSTSKHGFAPKLPGNTTTFLRGDGTYATPAAGGLTKFTEAENTSAPNGTVYVDSLTAAASSTNADVAIVPKGTGAFLLDVPDNTSTGGNKRGQYAVDLQSNRTINTCVASGDYSVILSGLNNTSSGSYSLSAGNSCSATNNYSVAIGSSCTSSGTNSTAFGVNSAATSTYATAFGYAATASSFGSTSLGYQNTASNNYAVALGDSNVSNAEGSVSMGSFNTANGTYSTALGRQSHAFGIYGRSVFASGQEGTSGDSQASKFILRERTTGNTATTLTTNSGAASTNNQVILSNQSAYRFKGTIIGKKSGTTDIAAWDVDGLIVRGANAAATTLAVSNVTLIQNTPAWGTPTLAADTTNGGLQVQVTGAATTNIQWTATIETTEVIYA
jgi:hypothetical protein